MIKTIGKDYVSLVKGSKSHRISITDPRYARACELLKKDNFEDYLKLFENNFAAEALKKVKGAVEFRVEGNKIFFGEYEVKGALADKINNMLIADLDLTPFVNFVAKLLKNPSANSVNQLYDFLGYKELAITPEGNFIAYKGVSNDYWSVSGNTKTKVLKGKVNGRGHIFNGIGEEIEVERNNVDDNPDNHCSFGLHVGSIDYARDFGERMVMVEVDPEHVVSTPKDSNFQKLRVCKYNVISDFEEEILASVAEISEIDEEGDDNEDEERYSISISFGDLKEDVEYEGTTKPERKKRRKIVQKAGKRPKAFGVISKEEREMVRKRLAQYALEGKYESVTVASVSNSFSPKYVKQSVVAKVASDMGYLVEDGWICL